MPHTERRHTEIVSPASTWFDDNSSGREEGGAFHRSEVEHFLAPPTGTLPSAAYVWLHSGIALEQVDSEEIRASLSTFMQSIGRSTEEVENIERLLSVLRTRLRERGVEIARGQEEQIADQMLAAVPRQRSTRAAEVIGPCYDTGGLTSWLNISKQAVGKRRRRYQLLGLQQNGLWAYPAWQFQPNAKVVITGLQRVLEQLAAGTDDSWAWALWMSARLPGQLDGKAAWEWLRDGGPADDVLVLARHDAASWAAA